MNSLKLPLVAKRAGHSGETRIIIDADNVIYGSFDTETAHAIVRAVNSHADLLEACRNAVAIFDNDGHGQNGEKSAVARLKLAIARAEAGEGGKL